MPLLMFAVIDAAALLDEPFSECAAFHLCMTADYLIWPPPRVRRRRGVQAYKFAPNGLLSFDLHRAKAIKPLDFT